MCWAGFTSVPCAGAQCIAACFYSHGCRTAHSCEWASGGYWSSSIILHWGPLKNSEEACVQYTRAHALWHVSICVAVGQTIHLNGHLKWHGPFFFFLLYRTTMHCNTLSCIVVQWLGAIWMPLGNNGIPVHYTVQHGMCIHSCIISFEWTI